MTKKRRRKATHVKQLREIFRIFFDCKRTSRDVAKILPLSPSIISRYLNAAKELGLSWEEYKEQNQERAY